MTEDDVTIEADDATMAELRRLAAEARGAAASAPIDDDVTVVGGSAEVEEILRLAAEARESVAATPEDEYSHVTTSESGHSADEMKRIADRARMQALAAEERHKPPRRDEPPAIPVDGGRGNEDEVTANHAGSSVPRPTDALLKAPTARDSAVPVDDRFDASAGLGVDAYLSSDSDGWQPPNRTVLPTEPEKHRHAGPGPWKLITALLGFVVVVLLALIVLSAVRGGSQPEEPVDGESPAQEVNDGESVDG